MVAMLRDCIYGQAVGDALGVPYEFMPRDTFKCVGMAGYGTHNQPPGTWSDDTSMALAICDSYRELGPTFARNFSLGIGTARIPATACSTSATLLPRP